MNGLFLDFDGVLCDSVAEAYYSSYFFVYGTIPQSTSVPPEFRRLRSYIRNGEDFILLQEVMKKKLEIRNQKDFDAFRATKDSAYIANLQGKFLETRLLLLEEQPETWLTLNPLFPGIAEKLRALSRSENIFILSTKNEDLIGSILKHHKIDWPDSRIINALNRDKIMIIESYTSFEKSIFIDDQLDHLVWDNKKVICYLALWGYLDKTSVPNVPALEYETFLKTLESLAGS